MLWIVKKYKTWPGNNGTDWNLRWTGIVNTETASKSHYFIIVVAVGIGVLAVLSLLKMLSEFTEKGTHTVEDTKLWKLFWRDGDIYIFFTFFNICQVFCSGYELAEWKKYIGKMSYFLKLHGAKPREPTSMSNWLYWLLKNIQESFLLWTFLGFLVVLENNFIFSQCFHQKCQLKMIAKFKNVMRSITTERMLQNTESRSSKFHKNFLSK